MAEHKPSAASGAPHPPTPAPPPEPAVVFTASPALTDYVTKERTMAGLKCPQCGSETKEYQGANPHKQGSAECPRCALRVRPA